jgi:hypothetical protein
MLPVRLVQQYGRYLLSADLSPAVCVWIRNELAEYGVKAPLFV